MDNFSIPTDTPAPDTPTVPASPAVTSWPDIDAVQMQDNAPPPLPEVEDEPRVAAFSAQAASWLETVTEKLAVTITAFPVTSLVVAGVTGFGAAWLLDRGVRRRFR